MHTSTNKSLLAWTPQYDDNPFSDSDYDSEPNPLSEPGAPSPKPVDFKLHIAVDFGTDGLGIAYAYKGKIYAHSKYKVKRYASKEKPKTMVMIDKNTGEAASFGMEARFRFVSAF